MEKQRWGIKFLSGKNTHPGSGDIESHKKEHTYFLEVLDNIKHKKAVMIEIGSFWAIWSLLFRKRFPNGKNILIELGKKRLDVGLENFKLNRFSSTSYHGGFCLNESNTLKNEVLDSEEIGPELNFFDICREQDLDVIDLVHMDIQGSELLLLESIKPILEEQKILNLVVATHSDEIHKKILEFLLEHKYIIKIKKKRGRLGNDGYIYARALKPPLLVSLPRSGLNWLRYCIEYFSKLPTPGEPRLIIKNDDNRHVVSREHFLRRKRIDINEHSKAVLILRNYKESYVRHANQNLSSINDYIINIRQFDRYRGPKLVTYYEDLISDTNAITSVLGFLDIKHKFSNIDINQLKQNSLELYIKSVQNKSVSGGSDIHFHSKNLSLQTKKELDQHFMEELGPLYNKYLAGYKELL